MNSQSVITLEQRRPGSPRSLLVQSRQAKRAIRLSSIAGFLFRAGVGGAFGAYLFAMGLTVYFEIFGPPNESAPFVLLFLFPFISGASALLALVTGALTLGFENLIEEKLTMLPRAIATGIFSVLILLALYAMGRDLDWFIVKVMLLPGLALGFPVGLLTRVKLNLQDRLIYGGQEPVMDIRNLDRNFVLFVMGILGGVALRLVGVIGFMLSSLGLMVIWPKLETHEQLVMVYAVYYFGCTALVSFCMRSRRLAISAAVFLNTLLLALALFWEPSDGIPSPVPPTFVVLALLWLLFLAGWARPAKIRRLATSFQEN